MTSDENLEHRKITEKEWNQFSEQRKVSFVQSRNAVIRIKETGENITPCHLKDDTICTQEVLETHDDGSPKVIGCTEPRYSKTEAPEDCSNCPLYPTQDY